MSLARLLAVLLIAALPASTCSTIRIPRPWSKEPGSASKLFAFQRKGKVGFIDATGKIVIAPNLPVAVADVGDFVDGVVQIGDHGFINESGQPVAAPMSEELAPYSAKPYRYSPPLKGFIDRSGKIVVSPEYADVGPFVGDLARVVQDGNCHVAKPNGWKAGTPTTGSTEPCTGIAPAEAVTPCGTGFINRTGAVAIAPRFESARDFQDRLAAVRLDGKWGYIDTKGELIIPARFEAAKSFREGFAAVQVNGKWGFADRQGKIVIAPQFDDATEFSEGLAAVKSGGRYYYVATNGAPVVSKTFLYASPFVHGLASVQTGEKDAAYIDRSGRTVFRYRLR